MACVPGPAKVERALGGLFVGWALPTTVTDGAGPVFLVTAGFSVVVGFLGEVADGGQIPPYERSDDSR